MVGDEADQRFAGACVRVYIGTDALLTGWFETGGLLWRWLMQFPNVAPLAPLRALAPNGSMAG
jgi:hypothetical protein